MCGTVMDVAALPYMSGHCTTVVISHDEIGFYQLLRGWKGVNCEPLAKSCH